MPEPITVPPGEAVSRNPATGAVIERHAFHTAAEIEKCAATAA